MTRRPFNRAEAEPFRLVFPHGQLTADTTLQMYQVATDRHLEVTRVQYLNPTGLTEDAANNFAGDVMNDAVVVAALFNTDSNLDPDTGASLAVDTFVDGVLAADLTERWLTGDEILSLVFTETGDATLPPGHLVVEGYLY